MFLEVLGVFAACAVVYKLCCGVEALKDKREMKNILKDMPDNKPYLSQYTTFGSHKYRKKGEVAKVLFANPQKNIVRIIIEDSGYINNFPGFEHPKLIANYLEDVTAEHCVKFRSDFEDTEDGIMFLWQIQPDGRYWEDEDGYGSGKGAELTLYSYLNDEGLFKSKFRIYRYASTKYFGTDLEDTKARVIE